MSRRTLIFSAVLGSVVFNGFNQFLLLLYISFKAHSKGYKQIDSYWDVFWDMAESARLVLLLAVPLGVIAGLLWAWRAGAFRKDKT